MKVLILGLSSIAQRRVIPALAQLDAIEGIDIASLSKKNETPWAKMGVRFSDYSQALARSNAEIVYISLPNSLHEQWIMAALSAGKHVVVDKPAAMTFGGAKAALAAAERGSRLIAEATAFSYHAHIAKMLEFAVEQGPLTQIDALFVIPPLPKENFRSSKALGGGCLLDMGAYAAAVGRLFGGKLEKLAVFAAPSYSDSEVDMGFTLAARYSDGLRYTGHFSFESEYQNRILVIGRAGSLEVERVFSPPPDLPVVWQVRRRNKAEEIVHAADDAFRRFFAAVVDAIRTGEHTRFAADLIADATFRDELSKRLSDSKDG